MTHTTKKTVDNLINTTFEFIQKTDISSLDKAIHSHFSELMQLYIKNKLFYKSVFKSYRFNLACLIITEYYTKENSKLLDVTNQFLPLKLMSKNSISTFYNLLVVTGRIKVWRSKIDGRRFKFSVTDKLKNESFNLIRSMALPMEEYITDLSINYDDTEIFLINYFKHFSKIVYSNNFNFDKVENADIFISKDAGHTIILNLFCHRTPITEDIYKTISVRDLSNACGVSRSHIKKILIMAENAGFIFDSSKENEIIITSKFLEFTREYMSLYFSFVLISLNM